MTWTDSSPNYERGQRRIPTPVRWLPNAEELRRLVAEESALALKDKPPPKG